MSTITSSGLNWSCQICHRSMAAFCKDAHLKGRRHIVKAAKATTGDVLEISGPQASVSAVLTAVEAATVGEMWKCDKCDLQMDISLKDSHLKEKGHRAAVGSGVRTPSAWKFVGAAGVSTMCEIWKCNPCGAWMNIRLKDSHLEGDEHRAAVVSSLHRPSPVDIPTKQTPLGSWECTVCNMKMSINSRGAHLSGKKHKTAAVNPSTQQESHPNPIADSSKTMKPASVAAVAVKPAPANEMWKCDKCDLQMNIHSKDSHLKGKKHWAAHWAVVAASDVHAPPPADEAEDPTIFGATWSCTECHVDMNASYKDTHLQGKKHRAAILKKSAPIEAITTSSLTPSHGRKGKKRAAEKSATYITRFFAQYPRFIHDPSKPATDEFRRLCSEHGWHGDSALRREHQSLFKDALVQEFNHIYGTDVNDVESWRLLCQLLSIDPIHFGPVIGVDHKITFSV